MASLHAQPYPGDWDYRIGDDWTTHNTRTDKMLADIPPDRVVRFPFADGHAHYFVFSERPLVLQHIPYGDAWHADPALIRGIRQIDIRKRVDADRIIRTRITKSSN